MSGLLLFRPVRPLPVDREVAGNWRTLECELDMLRADLERLNADLSTLKLLLSQLEECETATAYDASASAASRLFYS